jgi:hypothetical protein
MGGSLDPMGPLKAVKKDPVKALLTPGPSFTPERRVLTDGPKGLLDEFHSAKRRRLFAGAASDFGFRKD